MRELARLWLLAVCLIVTSCVLEPGLKCDAEHPCAEGLRCVAQMCARADGGTAGGVSGGSAGGASAGGSVAGGSAGGTTAGGSAGGATAGGAVAAGGSAGGAVAFDAGLVDVRRGQSGVSVAQVLASAPSAPVVRFEVVGTWELDAPLDIPESWCAGGGRRIEIVGIDGGAVLSGGRRLRATGFAPSPFPGAWAHPLPAGVPRDLYVLDGGLQRATWPDGPRPQDRAPTITRWNYSVFSGTPIQHVVAPRNEVPSFVMTSAAPMGLELVIPMGWSLSRLPVTGFFTEPSSAWFGLDVDVGRTEALKSRAEMTFLPMAPTAFGPFHTGGQRFRLENHPALLSHAGEWIANAGQLHIMASTPPDDVVVPVLERLVSAKGCSFDVRDMMAHTTWRAAAAGFVGANAHTFWVSAPDGGLQSDEAPAAIELEQSEARFERVVFANLGQTALEVVGGAVTVEASTFERVACTGLRAVTPRVDVRTSLFRDVGEAFACQGLSTVGASTMTIANNRFERTAAAAIYVFGGFFSTPGPSLLPDGGPARRVVGNEVEAASNLVTDTAAIHVGGQGLVIERNRFRNIRKPGWNVGGGFSSGVYLDIGSAGTQVIDNWFDDLDLPIQLNCQSGAVLRGNDAGVFGFDGGRRFLNSSYAGCLLFKPADGGGPEWQPLFRAMRDAGCSTDDAGVLLVDDSGFEQCACNALERRDCSF